MEVLVRNEYNLGNNDSVMNFLISNNEFKSLEKFKKTLFSKSEKYLSVDPLDITNTPLFKAILIGYVSPLRDKYYIKITTP